MVSKIKMSVQTKRCRENMSWVKVTPKRGGGDLKWTSKKSKAAFSFKSAVN